MVLAAVLLTCLADGQVAKTSPLDGFWDGTRGQTLRRLPVQVVPENTFASIGNVDFDTADASLMRDGLFRDVYGKLSPYNCITLTLRCRPDLNDPAVQDRVKELCAQAHADGIQVLMDVDARLARDEFLRRWPDEAQSRLAFEIAEPVNGTASFRMVPEACGDHLTYGARRIYDVYRSRLLRAWAVKFDEKGTADPSSVRTVTHRIHRAEVASALSGQVSGLAANEKLVVAGEFTHWSADVFSPNLLPYTHELMARYKELGADGAMHDEWGFPSTRDRQRAFRSFWYSKNFAAAYARGTGGRDLFFDAFLMVVPFAGRERERAAAIDAYFRLTFERNAEIETDFYNENRRLWGPEVYVTKHATWHSSPSRAEFFHDGLSWWAAKRDWAQSDEACDVSHCLGMMRAMGGPCWLNEGYGPNPGHYVRNVWRYALCGGRMVYHGIYGGGNASPYAKMPSVERKIHGQLDILAGGACAAEARVRLLNLISRAQPASAAALVFGHSRLMNWLDPAFEDYGKAFLHGLGARGYYVDSFPSTALGALSVDAENWVCAGAQRYPVVFLHRLSQADLDAWNAFTAGRGLKTRLIAYDSPGTAALPPLGVDGVEYAAGALAAAGAVRQTPFGEFGLLKGAPNRLPEPDGTLLLTDGTAARIKGCSPDPTGDPIAGRLETGGAAVEYVARGLFAARVENGETTAIAAGALKRAKGPGIDIELEEPVDVALVRRNGAWCGLLQVSEAGAEIPAPLKALTDDWRILVQPVPRAAP